MPSPNQPLHQKYGGCSQPGQTLVSQKRLARSFLLIFFLAATVYQQTYSVASIPNSALHYNMSNETHHNESSIPNAEANVNVSSVPNATTHGSLSSISNAAAQHNVSSIDESRRKTNVDVLEWLRHYTTFQYRDKIFPQIPLTFPRPQRPETIKIYNATAWQHLQGKLKSTSAAQNESFTLLTNGGSVSAGGGSRGKRYFLDFINYMQMTGLISSRNHIRCFDRAHGSRGSIHSALMRHSFFPPNVDLVIWEFSVNDLSLDKKYVRDPDKDAQGARRSLEMWLDAIEQITPHPPYVILMYLWDRPFEVNSNGLVSHDAYDSHQSIAARYPFVVGHVNMALYVEELEWGHEWSKRVFLHDAHHPTWLGHAVMGYLLLEFMTTDPGRLQRAVDQALDLQRNVTALKSSFGCDVDIIDEGKVSIADWTVEEPRNTEMYPGMLLAEHASKIVSLGKQDPTRNDRQRLVGLPCCHLRETVTLKLPLLDRETTSINGTVPMQARAIYALLMRRSTIADFSQVGVLLDGEDVAKDQVTVFDAAMRNCWERNSIFGYWLVLPEPREVHAIGLCSHVKESCAKASGRGAILLQSLSVWK